MSTSDPTVTIVVPTYREEAAIDACLRSVTAQTYPRVVEILVVDGGSDDRTRELAAAHPGVTVLDNPRRLQAAALNIGLAEARGDVFVRVDAHCTIERDYVEACVAALERTGAAMVGGAMRPVAGPTTPVATGIAAAMASPFGAGPARFHTGGEAGWADTVYLGAYRAELGRSLGGYAEDMPTNEDAELAHRMAAHGGIWFDPSIRSHYRPRRTLGDVSRQFYRYGRGRATTATRHPDSVRPRQMAAPILVLGLLSPARRPVALAYAAAVVAIAARERRRLGPATPAFAAVLPAMHLSWGTGFIVGLAGQLRGGGGASDTPAALPGAARPRSQAA